MKVLLLFILCNFVSSGYCSPPDSLSKASQGRWSFHFQTTVIDQYHGKFNAPYSGQNSLQDTVENDMSLTATIFLGCRLWKYAAFYFNPEVSGGKGLSGTTGIAGFPNGEIYRVGNPAPIAYIARGYFEQSFPLSGSKDTIHYPSISSWETDKVGQAIPNKRLTIDIGKFCLADFYDYNTYSHDARTQFMNWCLMDNGAWDYSANTRGYTYAALVQIIEPKWYTYLSYALEPVYANGAYMDTHFDKVFGLNFESGYKFKAGGNFGSISLLVYMNQNRAPYYEQAIADYNAGIPNALHIDSASAYNGNKKYGIGLNISYPLSNYIGLFLRAGWNDGKTGIWDFTEVDQTFSGGISLDGTWWKRKGDNLGLAYIANGISKEHQDFENAGGYQFIIGDGILPHYAHEQILETYYQFRFFEHFYFALDYQHVANPAYNADRGPVDIGSVRVHLEF